MTGSPLYEGTSMFMRWWPKVMLVAAWWVLTIGWARSIQWAALLVVAAFIHGRWLPWRFAVRDDGLLLTFPFGRHLFLPKDTTTVRMEAVGAIALVGRRRRWGYPLTDHLLYDPDRGPRLRAALTLLGYRLA